MVPGPHLPAREAQCPPEGKDCLLPLRNSGLKSAEEESCQVDCGSPMKKELPEDGPARAVWDVPAGLSSLPAIDSVGFSSSVGLPSKLCPELCLLGVIRCDLEKKSADHSLKTGQK